MTLTSTIERSNDEPSSDASKAGCIDEVIRQRFENCPYGFYFNRITWQFDRGRLTLSGSVPTFYMKELLREKLRGIEPVKQILDAVAVVSSSGVSSE